jgi:putative membrane protein insertion efficiency factor
MRRFLIGLISLYQKTLSPDHGWFRTRHPYGYCRYYPTCSDYTKQAIAQYGVRGLWLGLIRLLKCNPWQRPAVDLVP